MVAVEGIEELRSELEADSLGNRKVLQDRKIFGSLVRGPQAGEQPGRVSECVKGFRKGFGIDVLTLIRAVIARVFERLAGDYVRARQRSFSSQPVEDRALAQAPAIEGVALRDRHREARSVLGGAGNFPAT